MGFYNAIPRGKKGRGKEEKGKADPSGEKKKEKEKGERVTFHWIRRGQSDERERGTHNSCNAGRADDDHVLRVPECAFLSPFLSFFLFFVKLLA